jgi:hypothetical protein
MAPKTVVFQDLQTRTDKESSQNCRVLDVLIEKLYRM